MLNLTRQEEQVILFLISVALVGLGIEFLVKKYTPFKTVACLNQDMGKINLNQADKETLIGISGIGEKLAQRIIEYRTKQRRFNSLSELKNIKGITDSRYEKLEESLYVK